MTQLALIDAYQSFMHTAHSFVDITNEEDYEATLNALEQILDSSDDTLDAPLNPLIDILTHAIEKYESQDIQLMEFITQAVDMPADIVLLRTLMSQNQLTGSDLPEIGDKTMVSKVQSGQRKLSRDAIEKLSARFGLRPSMFFDEPRAS